MRHDDVGRDWEAAHDRGFAGCQSEGLRVVSCTRLACIACARAERKKEKEKQTGAVSDYALAQLVIAQPCEGVCRATDLKRADFLQILAFEQQVDLGPVFGGRECGEGFRREDGGFMDTGLDELECFDDGGAGERKGSRRHCGLWVWGFGGLGAWGSVKYIYQFCLGLLSVHVFTH